MYVCICISVSKRVKCASRHTYRNKRKERMKVPECWCVVCSVWYSIDDFYDLPLSRHRIRNHPVHHTYVCMHSCIYVYMWEIFPDLCTGWTSLGCLRINLCIHKLQKSSVVKNSSAFWAVFSDRRSKDCLFILMCKLQKFLRSAVDAQHEFFCFCVYIYMGVCVCVCVCVCMYGRMYMSICMKARSANPQIFSNRYFARKQRPVHVPVCIKLTCKHTSTSQIWK